ncbi:hypothetical protein ABWR82_002859 [Salmonella enterica subsp. enterica]|nr:hypothetical protein [Salmonella enterica subsp. enterica]EKS4946459.1 hypothetical protein [Salmonella enterica]
MENWGYRLGMLTRQFMCAHKAPTEIKPQPQVLKEEIRETSGEAFTDESEEDFVLYDNTQDGYQLGPAGPGVYVGGFKVISLDG